MAFIALSTEKKDTVEKIAEYREKNGISFPMGRDESQGLDEYVDTTGIPDTVIADRFGNAVFFHRGAFSNAETVGRVLDTFLGGGYTETAVLNEIPKDISTHAYPVSAARAIYPESGKYRKLIIRSDIFPDTIPGYIVPDDAVRLRIEIAADDDAVNMVYAYIVQGERMSVASLLDPERGVYVHDQEMPDMSDEIHYMVVVLYDDLSNDEDENDIKLYLFINEESVNELVEQSNASGEEGILTWEYADADEQAENTHQAYILHVVDQDNNPVEEVSVTFCTDAACVPRESDENGLITFTGAPDVYHVEIVDVPDGYSFDEEFEIYTPREYGEWVLRIRKD